MSEERWEQIPGFEGRYEASDRGRIRSYVRFGKRTEKRRDVPIILKPQTSTGGYQKVRLQGRIAVGVHQLVMLVFVGPCPPGHEVDHIDCDPKNNLLGNLQYLTHEANRLARVERRTKFKCGHPVAGNEYVSKSTRTCRECKRESWRAAAARRRLRDGHRKDIA